MTPSIHGMMTPSAHGTSYMSNNQSSTLTHQFGDEMTPVSHKPQGNLIEINNVIVVM
jgi:hypothetical protein